MNNDTPMADLPRMTVAEVRQRLLARSEIALIDVREEDPYAQAHPLWSVQLGAGRIAPLASGAKGCDSSCPRSMPIRPQTVWSCTGVRWPGPQTKLTTEKRSSGSQCSKYWR